MKEFDKDDNRKNFEEFIQNDDYTLERLCHKVGAKTRATATRRQQNIPPNRYHTVKNIQEELEKLNNVHIFVR